MTKGIHEEARQVAGSNRTLPKRPLATKIFGYLAVALTLIGLMVWASGALVLTDTGISGVTDAVNFGSTVNATNYNFGVNHLNRPLVSTANTVVTVCASGSCTYTSIQDAVDDVPLYLYHTYQIRLNRSGENYWENVTIPTLIVDRFKSGTVGESVGYLTITGNTTDLGANNISSMSVTGCNSPNCFYVSGVTFHGENPNDDEKSSFVVYGGSDHVGLYRVNFDCANIRRGILSYGGKISVDNVTFTQTADATYNCSGYAMFTKYLGEIFVKDDGAHGSVAGWAYGTPSGGEIKFNGDTSTLTGDDGLSRGTMGFVNEYNDGQLWGVSMLMGQNSPNGDVTINQSLEVGVALTSPTVDTGQGANELYDMDQNVLTSSDVTFADMTVTNMITPNTIDGGTFVNAVEFYTDNDAEPSVTMKNGTSSTNVLTIDNNLDSVALSITSDATTAANYGINLVVQDGANPMIINSDSGGNAKVEFLQENSNMIYAYRNIAAAQTTQAVVRVRQDNAGDDQEALEVVNDGTGDMIYMQGAGNQSIGWSNGAFITVNASCVLIYTPDGTLGGEWCN